MLTLRIRYKPECAYYKSLYRIFFVLESVYDSVIPGQYLCFCCKVLDVLEAEVHPIRTHVQRLDRLVDKAAKPKLIITSSLRNSLQINILFCSMTKETK